MSNLVKVTITGADDRTNIADLVELTEEFDFVERNVRTPDDSQLDMDKVRKVLKSCKTHFMNQK